MPFRYANQNDLLKNISADSSDTALIEYLMRIENALADVFDAKIGRSFGVAATPSTRTYRRDSGSCILALPDPARSITAVWGGGRWNGTSWDGEVQIDDWYELYGGHGVIYALGRDTAFDATVRVSAVWANDPEATVPADVQHALTLATAKQYRRETSTPGSDMLGPEGFAVPTPDPWADPHVKSVIAKYKVVEVIV